MQITIRTDTLGNPDRHSRNLLTACLWAAIRRLHASLPPEIVPGEWDADGESFTNNLLYEKTGVPCGAVATVRNPGINMFDFESMEIMDPVGTVLTWKPSPIDEFMILNQSQESDSVEESGQEAIPETDEDIEVTIDEFVDELFGDSLSNLVMHSRPVIRTVGTVWSLKFNLMTILEESILEAMEKRGKNSLPFVCRKEAWELRVVTDYPNDDEEDIAPGKCLVFFKEGETLPMEFTNAPMDVMFVACVNALDEQDQD